VRSPLGRPGDRVNGELVLPRLGRHRPGQLVPPPVRHAAPRRAEASAWAVLHDLPPALGAGHLPAEPLLRLLWLRHPSMPPCIEAFNAYKIGRGRPERCKKSRQRLWRLAGRSRGCPVGNRARVNAFRDAGLGPRRRVAPRPAALSPRGGAGMGPGPTRGRHAQVAAVLSACVRTRERQHIISGEPQQPGGTSRLGHDALTRAEVYRGARSATQPFRPLQCTLTEVGARGVSAKD
jgi:hypothetical protein